MNRLATVRRLATVWRAHRGHARFMRVIAVLPAMLVAAHTALAQPPGSGGPSSARAAAPFDLTGQWVSVITEDWRHRMMTPPRGDVDSVPVNAAGRAVAEAWDRMRDESQGLACRPFGAAALMRVPGRLRISWDGSSILRIEADAGEQVRLLHFADAPTGQSASWQGVTGAEWRLSGGPGPGQRNGSIRAVTTHLLPGYLRWNGVPYSADAVVTEHFDLLVQPDGSQWLVVQTIVDDPTYLTQPFITSSNFRRESGDGGWDPTPCDAY